MAITYNYEGPLAGPAVNIAYESARQIAQADEARRQQQMGMQMAMQQQQMANQRWLEMAGQQGAQRNIMAQGAMNQQLQQAGQQWRTDMAQQQNVWDQEEWDLRAKFNQEIMNQRLNTEGESLRRNFQFKLQKLDEAADNGYLNPQQLTFQRKEIYRQAAGMPWGTMQMQEGDPGQPFVEPKTNKVMVRSEDGQVHVIGDMYKTPQQQFQESMATEVDPQTGKTRRYRLAGMRNGVPQWEQVPEDQTIWGSVPIEDRTKTMQQVWEQANKRYAAELSAWSKDLGEGERPDASRKPSFDQIYNDAVRGFLGPVVGAGDALKPFLRPEPQAQVTPEMSAAMARYIRLPEAEVGPSTPREQLMDQASRQFPFIDNQQEYDQLPPGSYYLSRDPRTGQSVLKRKGG